MANKDDEIDVRAVCLVVGGFVVVVTVLGGLNCGWEGVMSALFIVLVPICGAGVASVAYGEELQQEKQQRRPKRERRKRLSTGEAWTLAWRDLRASLTEVMDEELAAALTDLVDVAYRDRLEQPEQFTGRAAAVVSRVRGVIGEYQRIVARLERGGTDDAGARAYGHNAAGSACLRRVKGCLTLEA
jgi:hypothetical protein